MASADMLADYGPIRSIPTTIFLDRQGRVVRRMLGYVDAETIDGSISDILQPGGIRAGIRLVSQRAAGGA